MLNPETVVQKKIEVLAHAKKSGNMSFHLLIDIMEFQGRFSINESIFLKKKENKLLYPRILPRNPPGPNNY